MLPVSLNCPLFISSSVFSTVYSINSLLSVIYGTFQIDRGRENHKPAASHWHTLSHNIVSSTRRSVFGYLRGVVLRIRTSGQAKDNKWHLLPLH
jgi:hypothetical protein